QRRAVPVTVVTGTARARSVAPPDDQNIDFTVTSEVTTVVPGSRSPTIVLVTGAGPRKETEHSDLVGHRAAGDRVARGHDQVTGGWHVEPERVRCPAGPG